MHARAADRRPQLPRILVAAALLPLIAGPAAAGSDAQDALAAGDDLFALSLEELVDTRVTSVAGIGERWFGTPAALTVISGEQLRRGGHRHLVEALRMAPGVHVGRIDARQWAIGVRGMTDLFSNDLQVVIDGRSVYNELFGGVFWDVQDPMLEDIERIEIVRGPGATLWGANAVKGVVNVITKSARDTHGMLAGGGGGIEERGFAYMRRGGALPDDRGHWRFWGRYKQVDSTELSTTGRQGPDAWNLGSGGFQLEFDRGSAPDLLVQGQAHTSDRLRGAIRTSSGVVTGAGRADGAHLLLRLTQQPPGLDAATAWRAPWSFRLQSYYDFAYREGPNDFEDERHTADFDLRGHRRIGTRHELMAGVGYRFRHTRPGDSSVIRFPRPAYDTHLVTAFVQDRIALVEERLSLLVGSKFEHNDFSGFEVQPSARLAFTPDPRLTAWAAVSRPVRTPTLVEEQIRFQITPTTLLVGQRGLEAERLVSYEIGARARLAEHWTIDVAAFYDDHDDLIVTAPSPVPTRFTQSGRAHIRGVEVSTLWQPLQRWRLEGSYSFLDVDARDTGNSRIEGASPRHQFQLHSWLDVRDDLQLDTSLYFVDRIDAFGIDPWFRLDAGITWFPRPEVELRVVGQNLAEEHVEFFQATRVQAPARIERGVHGSVTVRY